MSGQQEGDLAATFGTPARASLSGLIKRRTSAPLDPPATQSDDASDSESNSASDSRTNSSGSSATASKPARKPAGQERPGRVRQITPAVPVAAHECAELASQISVYLLPEAIQAARRSRGQRTNAELAWEAIDATHKRLAKLIASRHGGTPRPGSLFPARRTNRPATGEARRALWAMKATPAELAVVDRLVTETGASSRSELISTAIEAHLLADIS